MTRTYVKLTEAERHGLYAEIMRRATLIPTPTMKEMVSCAVDCMPKDRRPSTSTSQISALFHQARAWAKSVPQSSKSMPRVALSDQPGQRYEVTASRPPAPADDFAFEIPSGEPITLAMQAAHRNLQQEIAARDPHPVVHDLVEPTPLPSIGGAMQNLASALAQGIAASLETRLSAMIAGITDSVAGRIVCRLQEALDDATRDVTPEKLRKPLVVVVGVLAGPGNLVRKEFENELDLRIIDTDHIQKLKGLGANARHVFVMIDFVSHSHTEILKSVGAQVTKVVGGMDKLRAEITNWYAAQ